MQNTRMLWLVGLAACAAPPEQDDDDEGGADEMVDTGAPSDIAPGGDANEVDPDRLNGSVPDEALAAPEFAATNRDASGRDREDLLGHPTVIWFYPAAATAG